MRKFNVEEYRAELAKLKEHVREMDVAIDNLKHECGPGGCSDRTFTHLDLFGDAKNDAGVQLVEVIKAMLPGMPNE
jgi:hypothetical protein